MGPGDSSSASGSLLLCPQVLEGLVAWADESEHRLFWNSQVDVLNFIITYVCVHAVYTCMHNHVYKGEHTCAITHVLGSGNNLRRQSLPSTVFKAVCLFRPWTHQASRPMSFFAPQSPVSASNLPVGAQGV